MSADIIPLNGKQQDNETSHLVGTAKCLDCGREWAVVAPVGTVHLECPSCNTSRGVLAGPVLPRAEQQEWVCNCDCSLFKVVADSKGKFEAIMCIRCGLEQVLG